MPRTAPVQEFPEATLMTVIAPQELRSSPTRQGYDYWCRARAARRFPSRDDIKPRDIAGALTYMVLIKVIDNSSEFQFRIVGGHAGRGYGTDLTNRLLSDVAKEIPRPAENWRKIYHQVVESGMPLALHITAGRDAVEANFTEAEAVFLPLGSTEQNVEYVLTFVKHELKT